MAFKKVGKQLKKAKTWKKAFKKSGRILENSGYATTAVGTATGQPEIVAVGGSMIGIGKVYKGVAQGIKLAQGKKIGDKQEKEIKSNILSASKSAFE